MHDTSSNLDIKKFVVATDDATHTRIYANVVGLDFKTFTQQDKIVLLIDAPIAGTELIEDLEERIRSKENKIDVLEDDIRTLESDLRFSEAAERRLQSQLDSLNLEICELVKLMKTNSKG